MTNWHKTVRAFIAALMTTLLAVLMHVGVGGGFSVLGTVIVFVLVLWVSMMLAGRRLGYIALGSILGLGQVLMHLSMGWFLHSMATTHSAGTGGASMNEAGRSSAGTGGGGTGLTASDPGGMAAGHETMHHQTGTLQLVPMGPDGHTGPMVDDNVMLLAHVFAVLITAVLLKHGEDLLLTILQLAVGPVASALIVVSRAIGGVLEKPIASAPNAWELPEAITSAVIGANFRRGPPALV